MHKDLTALFDVAGKTAVVTGGTRGIGFMIATGLVKGGVKTYITSRKADACEAAQKELSAYGDCIALPYDLSTHDQITAFTDEMAERESALDFLINNAGATWGQPIDEFTEKGWDRVMDINLKSIFFLTQKLLPLLRTAATADARARVINIGSINGLTVPEWETYSYSASKAAVHHMTRVLAKRLAPECINVNAIAPGLFETKMMAFAVADDSAREKIAAEIPVGRIGTPENMIALTLYLCAPASDYMTGAVVPLDGGVAALV